MSGIYIHIPFCKQACHYCNFHFSTSLKLMDDMVDAIVIEMALRKNYLSDESIQTIYFGGGTPSLLEAVHFKKIFDKIHELYMVADQAEVTLEANPDDLSMEKIQILKEYGINRLSVGIQSFFDNDLQWMNRSHNSLQAHQVLEHAGKAGIDNISIDLIFGGLHATEASWKKNLEIAVEYKIPHISCYGLTIEERTALAHQLKTGKTSVASEEKQSLFYQMANDYLSEAGYLHYEISNYSLPGKLSVHNTSYWQQKPYIGLGPSAHSFNGTTRQWNLANNPKYIESLSDNKVPFTIEELTSTDIYNEYLMTGLRTIWGCDWVKLEALNIDAARQLKLELADHVHKGLITSDTDSIRLTAQGQLIADSIIASFFI
ncbi:MAG: radical SAM family heme chaperone HemW [Saprospiraceae bacterium]|nr:radical SAM family heme chaperone HemW [Saprospiraceae bacterium]